MPSDYKVGYKRPPEYAQFRKGKSGNPMGRPKGSKSLKRAMIDEANHKIEINEQGEIKRLSKMEAFAKQLWRKALQGDARAMSEVLKYCARFDLEDANEMEPRPLTFDEERYHYQRAITAILEAAKRGVQEQRREEADSLAPTYPDHEEF